MEKSKFIRRLDELGRITIPASLRKQFKMETGCYLEAVIDGNRIIMRKSEKICTFCGKQAKNTYRDSEICDDCIENIALLYKK